MFKRIRDGLEEGRRRYGAKNAGESCSRCGASVPAGTGAHRDYDVYCDACCKAKGYETDKELKEQRNDRPMGEYAKCAACDHEKALHTEGGSKCYTCGCADFKNTLKNAKCACGNEINPSSRQPFMEPMCDECIAEEKQYAKGERSYERENGREPSDQCDKCSHARGNHDADGACSKCDCTDFSLENAVKECPKCKQIYGGKVPDKCWECGTSLAEIKENAGPARCSCGGTIEPVAGEDDRFECDDCGQIYEKDDWRSDRYKAINAGSECATCGHRPSSHTDGNGNAAGCSICDCDKYSKAAVENASGRLIVAGGDSDDVAFVHCQTCDEGIDEKRIQDHLKDGHTVEKVMKVLKNDAPPLPGPTLGYEYGTSTTTTPAGSECKECGHALSQKFYDTNCQCRCHTELDNTVCDICRHEEGAGLEEHLMTRHGLEAEVAIVVAADMEKVRA